MCSDCWSRKNQRYHFYHLTKNRDEYAKCIRTYFQYTDVEDYEVLIENSIYDVELELRKTFSDQYFSGYLDDGHERWNRFLRFRKRRIISKYFWKEIRFLEKINKYQYNDPMLYRFHNIYLKYDLCKCTCKYCNNRYRFEWHPNLNKYDLCYDSTNPIRSLENLYFEDW